MEAIERVIVVPGTPGDVWPAVTESEEISEWFGAEAELDARPGGRGVFRWPDGASRHVVVEEVEPAHRLTFRWLPFQRTEDGDIVMLPSTRVEITLDEVEGGTRVRVVERGQLPAAGMRAHIGRGALLLLGA